MMTPQEVASHAFAKATFGGYNMAMVDEFLDSLTTDYTALYNDNAILKGKLKVLSDTIEEYRATDTAMRKTLLAAQQMADAMLHEAETKKATLVQDAEAAAARRIEELRSEIAAEEYRLKQAQAATAAYVKQLQDIHEKEAAFLASLGELIPPSDEDEGNPTDEIAANIVRIYEDVPVQAAPFEEEIEEEDEDDEPSDSEDLDSNATRHFENLQFSRDYPIE